jgi:glycosyltransferase involved in cell wall biosynthesis
MENEKEFPVPMRVAVLFDNLGPYHVARMKLASTFVDLLAVETAGTSGDYLWAKNGAAEDFRKATLFPDALSPETSREELARRLHRVLTDFKPAVVAVPGWSSRAAFLAVRWCQSHSVPTVVMSDSTIYDEVRRSWTEAIKKRYVRLCSAALVAGLPHTEYIGQLGMKKSSIFTGYDVVDNQYFAEQASSARSAQQQIRGRLRLPERYFLASARFIPKKNLPRLLEGYAAYYERTPEPWPLMILGDGGMRQALEALVVGLGLGPSVQMPGFVQYVDLPAYYGLAGAFIHASTSEQWGLVVNEAMAAGLPVLVSDRCGCAPDLVQSGVNGFTFDPESIEQLSELLTKISTMPAQELSSMGSESQRTIADWGLERFAANLKKAAEVAVHTGVKQGSLLDRLMLETLSRR